MKTAILLSDITSGERFASAPDEAVVITSGERWKGFRLEHHHLPPAELPEHQVIDHRLMINIGPPVLFENRVDNKWVKQVYEYGDFKLLADQSPNTPRWHNNLNILALAIDPDFAKYITGQENLHFVGRPKKNDPLITWLAELLFEEVNEQHLAGKIFGESLTTAFVMHLAAGYQEKKEAFRAIKGKLSSLELKRIIDYVHQHLDKNIGLHELADQVSLSAFHFSRLFRNTLGLAPHQFLLQLKLERAQRLMRKSNQQIAGIAAELGFTDQAHFSNAFKKATGFSPLEFRNL